MRLRGRDLDLTKTDLWPHRIEHTEVPNDIVWLMTCDCVEKQAGRVGQMECLLCNVNLRRSIFLRRNDH